MNSNDVDRALAAFGAQPMTYHSFEKHKLPETTPHVAAPMILDDLAYDPFAPQPVMHALDERLPDVLLPAAPPAREPSGGETMALAPPKSEFPPMFGKMSAVHELCVESFATAIAAAPVIARAEAVPPAPTPSAGMPRVWPSLGTAGPAGFTQSAAAQPFSGLSLPTLGAKFTAREKPSVEVRETKPSTRSLSDMFRVLNGRPSLASRETSLI